VDDAPNTALHPKEATARASHLLLHLRLHRRDGAGLGLDRSLLRSPTNEPHGIFVFRFGRYMVYAITIFVLKSGSTPERLMCGRDLPPKTIAPPHSLGRLGRCRTPCTAVCKDVCGEFKRAHLLFELRVGALVLRVVGGELAGLHRTQRHMLRSRQLSMASH
jgi:hypothetical protein